MSLAYSSIVLFSATPTAATNAKWFFTVQLKNGSVNVPIAETIDITFSPASTSNILGTVTTSSSTGRVSGSLPVAMMGEGTFTMRAVGRSTGIFSNTYTLTVGGGTPTTYDRLTIAVDSLTHTQTENFIIHGQLKLGTSNALVGGVAIDLHVDGALRSSLLTNSFGAVNFTLPAGALSVGQHVIYIGVSGNAALDTPTRTITVSGAVQTVGSVTIVLTNPSVTNLTDPFTFTGVVKDTAGIPMEGKVVQLGIKGPGQTVFVFVPSFATTNATGQYGNGTATNEGTYDFKASCDGVESDVVTGTRTDQGGDLAAMIVKRADGSDVTESNRNIDLNSLLTVSVAFMTANSTTGVQVWFVPAVGDQYHVTNITTQAQGQGSVQFLANASNRFVLGNGTIGVIDVENPSNNRSLNVNVIEGGPPPPPPPPPPGGGIGKTWSDMSFTEKALAVGIGAFSLPVIMQIAGLSFKAPTYTPKKRVHKSRINTKELARYLRRTMK